MRGTATRKTAKPGRLTGKTSAGDAFRRCLAASRQSLLRLEARSDALDTATVHHFRTTVRRMRSLLSAFKEVLPPGRRKAFCDRLKEVSQRYAALREWDVLIRALTEDAAAGDRGRLADVAAAAKQRRHAAAARHSALRDHIRAIERGIAAAPWLRGPMPGETELWNRPIEDFARDLLKRQRRKIREGARGLDLCDPESFHNFRIVAKKHRYTIEFLTPLYGKKATRRYLERLVAIQDVLGDLRDALGARELVAKLRLPPESRTPAAHWLGRRGIDRRAPVAHCLKAFAEEPAFWEK